MTSWMDMKQGLYIPCIPKRTPNIYTHLFQKGALYTLTKNRHIDPASIWVGGGEEGGSFEG